MRLQTSMPATWTWVRNVVASPAPDRERRIAVHVRRCWLSCDAVALGHTALAHSASLMEQVNLGTNRDLICPPYHRRATSALDGYLAVETRPANSSPRTRGFSCRPRPSHGRGSTHFSIPTSLLGGRGNLTDEHLESGSDLVFLRVDGLDADVHFGCDLFGS